MTESPATNPKQYDSPELDWNIHGAEDRSSRVFLREALGNILGPELVKGARVLDIGCGVGQLFNWLRGRGAKEITGIDPSDRNILSSKEKYSWVSVEQATLKDFASRYSGEKFDIAIALFVFEHIENLHEAFQNVSSLLKEGGKFFLIIGDKDFHISNDRSVRKGHFVSVEILRELQHGTVETRTVRVENGVENVMYDIFRPVETTLEAAEKVGMRLLARQDLSGPMSAAPTERSAVFAYLLEFENE